MSKTQSLFVTVLLLGTLFAGLFLYEVQQPERVLLLRLGRITTEADTDQAKIIGPGLHVKLPFVDSVQRMDSRLQNLEIPDARVPTAEKKELIVSLFAKWRINDFSKYYVSTGNNIRRTNRLLQEKIVDSLRAEFGRRQLGQVVSESRLDVMEALRREADKAAKEIGVEVKDVRIVRIDLPDQVSEAVYNLMRTERQRIAAEHRAEGQAAAEGIRAEADKQSTVIVATAEQRSLEIRGSGDAEATEIAAKAFGQDEEFYRFYRSLEAYRETFQKENDLMIIQPQGDFFSYFKARKAD